MSNLGLLLSGLAFMVLGAVAWRLRRKPDAQRGSVKQSWSMARLFGPTGSEDSVKAVASICMVLGALFAVVGALALIFGVQR